MIKVLFICLGNICRSPMAEFIMKDMIEKRKLKDKIYVESRATSTEAVGSSIYPLAKSKLNENNISCDGHISTQISRNDIDEFDMIVAMDKSNIENLDRMFNGYGKEKISLMLEHAGEDRDVKDPWYTRNFDKAYEDIVKGCEGILREIGY